MKAQIIYATKYNSTKQNAFWLKERLQLDGDFEINISDIKESEILDDSKFIVFLTGVYSGQAINGFESFINQNTKQLIHKDLIFISVAMEKSNCFNEENNLRILKNIDEKIKKNIILQNVLLGEMIYKNMDEEDKTSIKSFYESWMKLQGEDLQKALMPKTLLNKKDVWQTAQEIINYYKNEK